MLPSTQLAPALPCTPTAPLQVGQLDKLRPARCCHIHSARDFTLEGEQHESDDGEGHPGPGAMAAKAAALAPPSPSAMTRKAAGVPASPMGGGIRAAPPPPLYPAVGGAEAPHAPPVRAGGAVGSCGRRLGGRLAVG